MENHTRTPPKNGLKNSLFKDANFRWLVSGSAVSLMGDQFTTLALPWLVLQLTHDTLVLGIVLALLGIPRALLILVGGALVDRHSPKAVMMITKFINAGLLLTISLLLHLGWLQLPMVYGFALCLGISTAFSIPSGTSMLPKVVELSQLRAANGVVMTIRQVSFFLGPLLAGAVIALYGSQTSSAIPDAGGLKIAFLIDGCAYLFSAWTLSHVRLKTLQQAAQATTAGLLHSIAEGIRYCWNHVQLRTCFLYWAAMTFLIMGPAQVAMPMLATSLGTSASTLGRLGGAHGGGMLLGMILAGALPRLRVGTLGKTILLCDFTVGLLFIPLGMVHSEWQAATLLLLVGMLGGFLNVAVFTWIQQQVPGQMIGRTMSLFMFIFMGITPLSAALTGALMRNVPVSLVFAVSGSALLIVVVSALLLTPLRYFSEALPADRSAS